MFSVTRLGDLLHFGQLFKAYCNNYFAKMALIIGQFFVKVSKSFIFLVKSFFGNFCRHFVTFYRSHYLCNKSRNVLNILYISCEARF